jgi:hypothetical protein
VGEWREGGTECPIPPNPEVGYPNPCGSCVYFRGASYPPNATAWKVHCNWPRNGTETWSEPLPGVALFDYIPPSERAP